MRRSAREAPAQAPAQRDFERPGGEHATPASIDAEAVRADGSAGEGRGDRRKPQPAQLGSPAIADVNLELGRHDKALGLYHKVLEENPHLTVELGFRGLNVVSNRLGLVC